MRKRSQRYYEKQIDESCEEMRISREAVAKILAADALEDDDAEYRRKRVSTQLVLNVAADRLSTTAETLKKLDQNQP